MVGVLDCLLLLTDHSSAMKYPPVLTKRDFVRRYAEGEFGNHLPVWKTVEEFLSSGYRKSQVGLRNRIAGGPLKYHIEPEDVLEEYNTLLKNGAREGDLYVQVMAPHEQESSFQGEVMRNHHSYYLHWSSVRKPMRQALAEESHHDEGIKALTLIKFHLCANSYDWLQVLFDRYPDHVIEFSAFDRSWGIFPCMNTIFWEVRAY